MKRFLQLAPLVLALALGGCGSVPNDYRKFYEPIELSASQRQRLLPYSGKTEVYSSDNLDRDADLLLRRGYMAIGHSSFHGADTPTREQLRTHAQEVGADIVLAKDKFLGSEQSYKTVLKYDPGTTSTTTTTGTVNANAYNTAGGAAYGQATVSGSSTTTTPGTLTSHTVPVTIKRYSWETAYWRKASPPVFGALSNELPDELRQKLQRNTGRLVENVVDGSPAFYAEIVVGDVIVAIGEETALSGERYTAALARYAGQKVEVVLIRGTETKRVEVTMNPTPTAPAAATAKAAN